MPIGYKYVERAADSYVNYAEIGKNMSDMLNEEHKIREEKKAAIDEASRQYGVELADAPQGEFQDGNKFTTDFVDMMQKQRLMDDRLLKSGKLNLKDYILRRQNNTDDTKNLFDIQKIYQEKAPEIQKGLADGSLQAFNGFNMANAEGIKDLKNLRAMVDQTTGKINIARTTFDQATGTYKIVDNADNTQPVGVLKGKILQQVPTFMVDEALDRTAKGWSERIREQQAFATRFNLGNITTLTGDAINQIADPEAQATMRKWDYGVNKYVYSLLIHPYDLMSVLTENTGKYGAESYTFDRGIADSDESKILLKMNPNNSGLGVIDETGKTFKKQKEEAASWVKSQLNNKFDNKIQSEEGKQVSNQDYHVTPDYEGNRKALAEEREADIMGKNISKLLTGNTAADVSDAINYAKAHNVNTWTDADGYHLIPVDAQGNELQEVVFKRGTDPKKMIPSILAAINSSSGLNEKLVEKAALKYTKNEPFSSHVIGKTVEVIKEKPKPASTVDFDAVANSIKPEIFSKKMGSFATAINPLIKSLGYRAVPQKDNVFYNTVDIVDSNGNIVVANVQTNYGSEENRDTEYTRLIAELEAKYKAGAGGASLNASDIKAGKPK